jgi:signal transduction histidine kinase
MEKVNILLVDDQPAKLLSYEVILAELGENLIKANSAREALASLLRNEVAVVLTDVSMPETDGFELAAMIREHPRFQRTAIIFVSAIHLTDPDRLKGYAAGAVDYLPVPLVPELMRAKVKVFAELYRKTRELERLNEELESRVSQRTAELELANARLEQRVEERTREREAALAQIHEMQKMETLGQLTGGVAHDFNNLLMAITGNLELLKKRLPDNPTLRRLADGALAGAERGATLTKRMLAFARRQELRPTSVNLCALITNMEDLLARSLGPTVIIRTAISPDLPPILVDQNELELALLNLSLNARDAMPEGGDLLISAESGTAGGLSGLHGSSNDYISIMVSDTGSGMDEATLAKATEPFFTTKGIGKGTGLGLSMVQGLVAQSGGTMRIQSCVGHGTQIWFCLPVDRSCPVETVHVAPKLEDRELQQVRVVVVDDDPLILSSTALMLEDLGHSVTTAGSGPEALEQLAISAPQTDVVIMDYAMPGMNGLQLADSIRRLWPWLPVILASGYVELVGTDGTEFERLAKPYTQTELSAALERVSRERKIVSIQSARSA